MNTLFGILTVVFILISAVMILVILVQRPQGGGLAGAFGGSGGGGTETVFGGRVGDALTVATVIAFVVWLGLAVGLNLVESSSVAATPTPAAVTADPNAPPPVTGLQEQTLPSGEVQTGTRLQPPAATPPATDSTGGSTDASGGDAVTDDAGGDAEIPTTDEDTGTPNDGGE